MIDPPGRAWDGARPLTLAAGVRALPTRFSSRASGKSCLCGGCVEGDWEDDVNINHLHLKVASVERAAAFYEGCFGLRRHVSHGEILFMRDEAGMDFALAPASEPASPPAWFHLGFRLKSAGQVERLYAELTENGVSMRQPLIKEDDLVSFRCADPDGYGVEVYWEPEPGEA